MSMTDAMTEGSSAILSRSSVGGEHEKILEKCRDDRRRGGSMGARGYISMQSPMKWIMKTCDVRLGVPGGWTGGLDLMLSRECLSLMSEVFVAVMCGSAMGTDIAVHGALQDGVNGIRLSLLKEEGE
jgi:hypothetical protein